MAAGFATLALSKVPSAEVTTIPGRKDPLLSKMYAGMYNVSRTRGLFYTLVESQSDPVNDPLLVWFVGGPGGASTVNIFSDIGPYIFFDN